MKKLLIAALSFVLLMAEMPAAAREFSNEESFEFDIYDINGSFSVKEADESVLMEIDDSVKEKLEKKLFEAWEGMATEVQLYPDVMIHKNDIVAYYSRIFFENPQYYYVVRSFSGTSNSAGYMGKLTKLKYNVDSMEPIRAKWAEIDKATEEILFNISPDMTDFEKVMTVHDYMDLHYVYDITDMDQTYFVLLDKVGVCAAYAEAFQHVMNVLGIESSIVTSEAMGHMWNMVKIDGKWYHADVTWDDPVPDMYAEVCHQYMLLSENAIIEMGHHSFDAPYYAGSTKYNAAPWHDEMSALVTVGGVLYRIEGNEFVDEDGNVIYKNLDGGDGIWHLTKKSGIRGVVFAGLCEINDILYFNTDTGLYSYNPQTGEIDCILEEYGICGLYADKNTIYYSTYDFEVEQFIKKGEIAVCGSFVKKPYCEDGKAVIKVYNDEDSPIWIISEGEGYRLKKVEAESIAILEFENGASQRIYIWKDSFEPLVESFTVSE